MLKYSTAVHYSEKVTAFTIDRLHFNVLTTNGIERQHQAFKYEHLSDYTGGSLTDFVQAMVRKFIPSSQRKQVLFTLSVY
jgi:hypothetical protein